MFIKPVGKLTATEKPNHRRLNYEEPKIDLLVTSKHYKIGQEIED